MIAFGCSVISPDLYRLYAQPGIERAREPDSKVLVQAAASSVARGCNLLFDHAARSKDLEALVVVHQDVEIMDPDLCGKVRRALADPEVGVLGCVGVTGARGIAWWEGTLKWTSSRYRYGESGGGKMLWPQALNDTFEEPGEVDSLYGVLMVFSPWAVRNVRFDESFGLLHGYDFDICAKIREAGRKVMTTDIQVDHHHSLDLVTQVEMWVEAHMRAAERWDQHGPAEGDDEEQYWKTRARRAEADAAAARLLAASKLLRVDASLRHHQEMLGEKVLSRSWKVTEPLRRGNRLLRTLRERTD